MPLIIKRNDYNYRNPIRETVIETGRVKGIPGGNRICTVFKGIPYAAPPVGELRWKRPQPANGWKGVRECFQFGPAAYQLDRSYEECGMDLYPTPYDISEDCLYLNVWTPAETTEDKLPVYFWSHGGGNFGGFGSELENDGEGLAKRGVILVTYNYRLNAFGFLAHPELSEEDPDHISGNYALLDAIAAFQWVKRNIAAFGGDPDHIVLGGQSAGCRMTSCLCVSPMTRGQYAGATFHSGVYFGDTDSGFMKPLTLEEAEKQGIEFMKAHKCSNIAQLRALSAEQIMETTEYEATHQTVQTQLVDGVTMLDDPRMEFQNDNLDDVPYIVLCTADEGQNAEGKRQVITQSHRKFCEDRIARGKKPVYAFRFSRPLPGDDNGAWHTAELFYLFETIQRTWRRMTGYDFELQTRMADYWANFIKTGDPNGDGLAAWKPYTEDCKKVMDLGTVDGMMNI